MPFVGSSNAQNLRGIVAELARRKIEGLRLYEPLHEQLRFHASVIRQRMIRGGNRSGKTVSAAVEVARAVTGQDPFKKYPLTDGRLICVGKDLDEIGQVMWRKLWRADAYKIIRDQVTGIWRSHRPWDPADALRQAETKPAPPLIPPRMIRTIAWENKAKGIPKQVSLRNGWEITFYSSLGKPPTGRDVDIVWFDEEIVDPEWYPEMMGRLIDRRGRFIWSATPQAGSQELLDLHERAAAEAELDLPRVAEFVMLMRDNPHIDEQDKIDFAASLSEEQQAVRVDGEFAVNAYIVFPEFRPSIHGVDYFDIPDHWTRYVIIDPGRQVCAALFAAISPKDQGSHIYIYDELYIKHCDAEQFGQKMRAKCAAQTFEAFIMDRHGGALTDIGAGRTVERQYADALRRNRVTSRRTGSNFIWGADDREAGIEACRLALRIRPDGMPKIRVILSKTPAFKWEIEHYRYKRVNGIVIDKPEDRGRVHAMDCFRYLCMANPRFVKHEPGKAKNKAAYAAFLAKKKAETERNGPSRINLGPGGRTITV